MTVWASFLTVEQVGRTYAMFKRAKRYCSTDNRYDTAALIECTDSKQIGQ